MAVQKRPEFILKRFMPMVVSLICDVLANGIGDNRLAMFGAENEMGVETSKELRHELEPLFQGLSGKPTHRPGALPRAELSSRRWRLLTGMNFRRYDPAHHHEHRSPWRPCAQ